MLNLVRIYKELLLNINGCYFPEAPKDILNCDSPHDGCQMQYFGGTTNTIFCKLEKFVR
jgi:hypothetical protein